MVIVVAGRHAAVRQGVMLLLGSVDGWVVREAHGADDLGDHGAVSDADVVVLDLDPFAERLPLLRRLAMRGVPVVALVTTAGDARIASARASGAVACVAKQEVDPALLDAVRDAGGTIP